MISALVGQGANPQLLNTAGKKPIDMVEDLEVQKKVLQAIKEGCNIKNRLKAKG